MMILEWKKRHEMEALFPKVLFQLETSYMHERVEGDKFYPYFYTFISCYIYIYIYILAAYVDFIYIFKHK